MASPASEHGTKAKPSEELSPRVRRGPESHPRPSLSEWNRRIELLERAPVFFMLPAAVLRAIARRLRPVEVRAGTVIVSQGEVIDSLLFVESGRATLRVEQTPGRMVTVASLGPGELFGESSLGSEPSPASMIAAEDTRLLALDRQSVNRVLERDPEIVAGLHRLADQRRRTFPVLVAASGAGEAQLADVVAVYSAKGGSGRTTIALNLAAALARKHPGEVLLIDLALPFNHAALLANLVPSGSLARVAGTPGDQLGDALLGAVVYHVNGMLVLPGTLRAEEADQLEPQHIHEALEILRPAFRYVILDLGTALDDLTLAALERSQRLVLVTTPELTTLQGASELLDILEVALGITQDAMTVVLNHRSPRAAVSREAVERSLGRPVDVEIRHDGLKADEAALHGILSIEDPKSEMSIGARAVAELLAAAPTRHGGA